MFSGVKREEYDKVVHANNEMRMKMEKLRLENTLLKDQIRALGALPPTEGPLYNLIQEKNSITLDEILASSKLKSIKPPQIRINLQKLMDRGVVTIIERGGVQHYSVATPDTTGGPISKDDGQIHSSEFGTSK